MLRARSTIFTGSPISSTKTSPPVGSVARADDQLHRLGDRHEVAGHLLVGHRHRAAGRDLAAEDRHDRARRAEHVAEPHRRVAGVAGSGAARPRRPTRRAPSTRPSRSPGETALSVETSTKRSTPASPAAAATMRVADGVVADRLDRVLLHQRHVLVGGGVEDDRRPVLVEHLAHADGVLAVGQHRGRRGRSGARPRARGGSRRARSRRSRPGPAACGRRARSGGRARRRSSRRRRSRARSRPLR